MHMVGSTLTDPSGWWLDGEPAVLLRGPQVSLSAALLPDGSFS